jgi:hypothetical protein
MTITRAFELPAKDIRQARVREDEAVVDRHQVLRQRPKANVFARRCLKVLPKFTPSGNPNLRTNYSVNIDPTTKLWFITDIDQEYHHK